jgi:hypothetical protein
MLRLDTVPGKRIATALVLGCLAAMCGACGSSAGEPQVVYVPGATPTTPMAGTSSAGETSSGSPSTATSPAGSTSSSGSSGNPVGGQVPSSDGGVAAASGLPCDVAMMLAANCGGCHSDPPITGALAGLVTYADLMAPSHEMPSQNEAQLSVSRMKNAASPMPPGSLPPASDVTILQNWISAGYPKGSCGAASADGGANGASSADGGVIVPSSSVFSKAAPFSPGTPVNGNHKAGQDCMSSCHNHGFTFAGTLFDANGAGVGGAEVRLVDAKGLVISVYTDNRGGSSQGNFYGSQAFVGPAHVGARNASSTQDMHTALQSTAQTPASTGGACNACHCTGTGCTVAPIHLP